MEILGTVAGERSGWKMQRSFTQKPARQDSLALVPQIERDVTLLPDDIVQEIVTCSDGVPLFLEEVTRTVLEAASADVLRPKIGVLIAAKLEPRDVASLVDRAP